MNKRKKMIKEFLTKHKIAFESTEDGIHYVMENQPDGPKATVGQHVKVHYTGKFVDGQTFDSSLERDMPFVFELGKWIIGEDQY